jgi:dTDP-4-amino-4,6-dideoxygalactose transaminase
MKTAIPFFLPYRSGREEEFLVQALASSHWSGDGPFSKKCSKMLEDLTGAPVLLTPSGTHALELAFMTLNLEPGSEVILPSYTFVSSATCLVQFGLKPVFVDVREDTLNIDETLIEQAISDKTRAILAVHYAGVAAEMDAILAIARKYGLAVVEDAAQAVRAFYKGKALGSLGNLGAFSFHHTKNFSCGEGGALVVADRRLFGAAEIHREKGTDRKQFLEGRIEKYTWRDRGSSYLLSDLSAAVLCAQLSAAEEIAARKKRIYETYREELSGVAPERMKLPVIPSGCRSNHHFFHVLLESATTRSELARHLRDRGVETAAHFVPLHDSPAGSRFGTARSPLDVSKKAGETLLRLPSHANLTPEEQERIIGAVKGFFP